ncbi:hypothetical protein BCR36DRAFT_412849 [Piromyces finnis]|uniref:Uncharacterized protein n=1 Tax=Piromyces finnis TaxID=1754191 RepID=A0A1Y1V9R0_9FUNG|nr:hypothetical protein BCR36DRAFT_412849 [Piromyces finnis]|eukprot:ORX49332.1 hypothetical protein BCR36DRAFT_412849 [Piromyces finnis]
MTESSILKNIRLKLTKAFKVIEYDLQYPKDNSIEIVKEALREPYKFLIENSKLEPNLNTSKYFFEISKNELYISKKEFASSYYQRFLEFIIEHVCVNWYPCFSQEEKKEFFENYFIPNKNVYDYEQLIHKSFYVMCHHISHKEHNFILQEITKFLNKFLQYNTVYNFLNVKKEFDDSMWIQYVTLVSFLPDKMVSVYKLNLDDYFMENNFFKKIGLEISQAINLLSTSRNNAPEQYIIERLIMLISKLFRLGKTDLIVEPLYLDMKKKISNETYKLTIHNIIKGLNMPELEKLFDYIFKQFQQFHDDENLLKNALFIKILCKDIISTCPSLQFLFGTKFLVRKVYNIEILKILIYFFHTLKFDKYSSISLISILQNFVNTWLDSYFMNNASKLQHQNITYGILICLSYLKQEDFQQTDIEIKFLKGVGKYLESTKYDIRIYGMIIAECMSERLHKTEKKLDFELDETNEVLFLRSLYKNNLESYANEHSEIINNDSIDKINEEEDDDDNNTIDNDNYAQNEFSEDENPDEVISELDMTYDNSSDDESDDDLEPYYMEEEEEITSAEELKNKIKPPLYIRDCIDGLLAEEEPNKIEVSINSAPGLIKSYGSNDLKEFGIRLTSILLSMSNNYELDHFEENRQESLNNLLVKEPILIAPYICEQFYKRNYNLSQRFIMLNALSTASNTLSSFIDNTSKEDEESSNTIEIDNIIDQFSKLNQTNSYDEKDESTIKKEDISPIKIIADRIEQHTRRFSRKSLIKKKVTKENKFYNCAKYFFFPLIGNFDCTSEIFTSLNKSEQSLLLERLILTLGIITYCAMNSIDTRRMCRELWNFCWSYRFYETKSQRCNIRNSILFSYSVIFNVLSEELIIDEFGGNSFFGLGELEELYEWIMKLLEDNKVDAKDIKFSTDILYHLKNITEKKEQQLFNYA